jgi:tetratricopeptide (TPR) repeat protein
MMCCGCKKYLDVKPDKKLVVPESLSDLQAILDYYPDMLSDPGSDEVSADNYYLAQATYDALFTPGERRIYTWEKDKIFDEYSNGWSVAYKKIFDINTVLDNLEKINITQSNVADYNHIKGQALFLRAKAFFQVAVIWSLAYDAATAGSDLGIPLRLHADFTETSVRSRVQETYDRIISDLTNSIPWLPPKGIHVTRASKSAAYAYLAKVYLSMRMYEKAGAYADSCLQISNTLIDYNTLSATPSYPIPQFNAETILYSETGDILLTDSRAKADSVLYASYAPNDLRKLLFFRNNGDGTFAFKGNYTGSSTQFGGMATDEVLLMRAECAARAGNKDAALSDLNTLLVKRWKTGTFVPVTAADAADALAKVLAEKRKELLFRSSRWMDIKRLNKEGAGIILRRYINNQVYTLPPNDPRYALPLPEDVINLSGMPQNPR